MKFARYKKSSPVSYALGATLCYELLKTHSNQITRVFLRPNSAEGEQLIKLIAQIQAQHIPLIESDKPFNVLDAKANCLLIAEFTKNNPCQTITSPQIVLVNPSDSGNLGTIMRSAVGFGFRRLAIIEPAVDSFDPKVVRASMGAIFHLQVQHFDTIEAYLKAFPDYQRYAFMLNPTSAPIKAVLASKPAPLDHVALIFGNEATGLPATYAQFCQPVILKQTADIDSLNLSVAASIAMYQFFESTN